MATVYVPPLNVYDYQDLYVRELADLGYDVSITVKYGLETRTVERKGYSERPAPEVER